MKIGILGTGSVAIALGKGWARENHQMLYGSRNPGSGGDRVYKVGGQADCGTLEEAVDFSDVVVLAVPYRVVPETVRAIGPAKFKGKTVIDVTNVLTDKMEMAVGFDSSGAEEIAKMLPGAKVVKAFNTVFADNMSLGRFGATKLAAFIAGDDAESKKAVSKLASDLGFEPIDAGPLKNARYLEPMGMQVIQLGYVQKLGAGIALALLRKRP